MSHLQDTWDATMMRLRLPLDADTRTVLVALAIALHNELASAKPGVIGWSVAP